MDGVITLLNLVLLGLVGLTPYVARMIAEAGPTRGLPFYMITVGSVFASIALMQAWILFRPKLFHAGVDRGGFRLELLYHALIAAALVGLGSWAIWRHAPVNGNLFAAIVVLLAASQKIFRRRRRLQISSTSRP